MEGFVGGVLDRRLNSFFYQDRRLLTQLVIVIILAAATKAYIIFGDYILIEAFIGGRGMGVVLGLFALFVLSGLANFILYTWQNYLIDLNTATGTYMLELALLKRIVELDTICFNSLPKKAWMNLFTNDVVKVSTSFRDQLNTLYSAVFATASLLSLALINLYSLLILLISTTLTSLAYISSARLANRQEVPISNQEERYLRGLHNSLENLPVALLSGGTNYLLNRFKRLNTRRFKGVLTYRCRALGYNQIFALTNHTTNLISTILMILLWSWSLLPFSLLLTANRKLFQIKANIIKLFDINKSLNLIKTFEERWLAIFKGMHNSEPLPLTNFEELRLEGVTLEIDGKTVIKELDLTLREGERLLIVGPSGSGKSTLLNLVTKRLLPTKGGVSIAGINYQEDTSLEGVVSFAPPSQPLLAATLPELLTSAGLLPLDQDRVDHLVELFNLDFLTKAQLEGVEVIEPSSLSEGQRKRLALAQLLYRPASLTVLDEPLSSLDPENHERIFNALLAELPSLIFVSHHLASQERARFTKILELRELD